MGHAVQHRDPSGELQFDEVDSLDAALELVERLRNEADAADVRVFREVPIEVKTYYRVSAVETEPVAGATTPATIPATTPAGSPAATSTTTSTSEPPSGAMTLSPPPPGVADSAVDPELPAEAQAPAEQRRALFSRS